MRIQPGRGSTFAAPYARVSRHTDEPVHGAAPPGVDTAAAARTLSELLTTTSLDAGIFLNLVALAQ